MTDSTQLIAPATTTSLNSSLADFIITQIDELIANQQNDIEIYRKALEFGRNAIHKHFLANAKASTLLSLRTAIVDHIIQLLWHKQSETFSGLALLAVGGYGRGELHPYSDIDIAILLPHRHDNREDAARDEKLGNWITSLWDLNLDIGHSVRTVSDCEEQAKADITVITNLMEARLVCGNAHLFDLMKNVIY